MLAYGSKDSLVKVASTDAGLEDTQAYLSVEDFRTQVTCTNRYIGNCTPLGHHFDSLPMRASTVRNHLLVG